LNYLDKLFRCILPYFLLTQAKIRNFLEENGAPDLKKKLTALGIAALPQGNYSDAIYPGLNLRIGAKRRTWSVFHRLGGKLTQTTIGHYPAMGLAEARKAADGLAERVEAGVPPEPAKPHPRAAAITLGDLVDRYERHKRSKGGRGTRTIDEAMRSVRKGLQQYLALPASAFSKHDLRAARDAIAKTAPTAANRFQAYLSPILAWAAAEDLIERNFSMEVIRVAAEVKRDRVLTHDEIRRIWAACDHMGDTPASRSYGRLVRFLLITGQRRDEVASLTYGKILDRTWRMSADETKPGRSHSIPLPPLALAIVGQGDPRELVFPGAASTKLSGWAKFKARLDRLSDTSGWRVHDLRRTAASGWQDGGADYLVVEGLLNHTLPGASGVYLRGKMEAAKRDVLAKWGSEVEKITGGRRAAS
jgi:integrase